MGWGCDIQAFNNAIDSGSTEVVQMFIDKDPSLIAYVGPHNKTCLDVALNGYMPWEKTVPMVRLLLTNSANPNKLTPLIWKAASSSYPKAVEELERHRAQPPKVDFLRTAIYRGSPRWYVSWLTVSRLLGKDDIVAFLLEPGASLTIRDGDSNRTPLETAKVNGRTTTANLLRIALQSRHA